MTRIRRLRLVLPAHMAPNAEAAAREIAARMVDTAWERGLTEGPALTLPNRGQSPAQIGLAAGRAFRKTGGDGGTER